MKRFCNWGHKKKNIKAEEIKNIRILGSEKL